MATYRYYDHVGDATVGVACRFEFYIEYDPTVRYYHSFDSGNLKEFGLKWSLTTIRSTSTHFKGRAVIYGTPKKEGKAYILETWGSNRVINGDIPDYRYEHYININAPLTITTESLPDGETGESYSAQLEAIGDGPIIWSIADGSLPPGLSLNPTTGIISGTPVSI